MHTHNLESVNAVRNSLNQLELLDYIEKGTENGWNVIDEETPAACRRE